MYKIFVDDSGHKDYLNPFSTETKKELPEWSDESRDFLNNNYFVLCGLHISTTDMGVIDSAIKELKRNTFGTEHIEIKSTHLRHGRNRKKYYLDPFGIDDAVLNAFGEALFDIIRANSKIMKMIATVFDKRQYLYRDIPGNNPLLKSTQVLFERVQYTNKRTLVIFDQMESSLRKEKGSHRKMLGVLKSNDGMERVYVDDYSNIIDIEFQESKNENFLQLADICSYTIRRQFMEHGKEWIEGTRCIKGEKHCSAYPYFDRIRCNFHHNNEKVVGCGLVLIPDFRKINWQLLKGCTEG